MKNLLLALCFILLSLSLNAQHIQHSRIMLNNRDVSPFSLAALGINTDHLHYNSEGFPILELSSHDIQKIKNQGIEFQVVIPDMQAWYESRNAGREVDPALLSRSLLSQQYPVPAGFSLGSLVASALTMNISFTLITCMQAIPTSSVQNNPSAALKP
jgi:hypothetical protein